MADPQQPAAGNRTATVIEAVSAILFILGTVFLTGWTLAKYVDDGPLVIGLTFLIGSAVAFAIALAFRAYRAR